MIHLTFDIENPDKAAALLQAWAAIVQQAPATEPVAAPVVRRRAATKAEQLAVWADRSTGDMAPVTPPVFTLTDVRARLYSLNKAGKGPQVKAILASFGCDNLTSVPAESYAEVMAQAEGLS
jgi:hypothetical protein